MDKEQKVFNQSQKQWTELQKLAKDTKKEIEKDVQQQRDLNNSNISNLEDSINQFT